MSEVPATIQQVFAVVAVVTTIATVSGVIVAAIRAGIIKQVTIGPLSFEASITPKEVSALESNAKESKPFEATALANYYNHALSRANISFWFSLVFASIGFGVIIFAFATHSASDIWGTVIKALSGTVIDAVSALFFVQSTAAQKSMSDFFEKLRLDRLNAEAREMITEIEGVERRDQLRAQLVLKYSGIEKLLVG